MMKRRHPVNRYQEAAVWREEMADWLDPANKKVVRFFEAWRKAAAITAGSATFPPNDTTAEIISNISRRVQLTEMFYLTTDVARFIYEASQTMPPHPIFQEDYPSSHGWLHLETPMQFDLIPGRNDMLIRGVMWTREPVGENDNPGAVFWDLSESRYIEQRVDARRTEPGLFNGTHVSLLSMGTVTDWNLPWMYWDMDFAPSHHISDAMVSAMSQPSVRKALDDYYTSGGGRGFYTPVPEGAEIHKNGEADGHWEFTTVEGMRIHMEPDRIARFMQCFFLFLNQELPALERLYHRLPKPWMQDLKKKYKHISSAPITIVNWRRRATPPRERDDDDTTGRSLHYRHVRRGHWRRNNRRKDPATGEWYLYPIYINPTIVGDANLPFRDRDVMNVVNR